MISGAYTSSGKAGRLFFKRTAFFFWEDSEWGAGLFARAPKGEPVYFSMICSASSSRRRLICHVVSARHPARDVQREIPHKPNTLLSPVFGICSRFGSIQPIRPPGALPCTSSYFSMKRWSMAAISARSRRRVWLRPAARCLKGKTSLLIYLADNMMLSDAEA